MDGEPADDDLFRALAALGDEHVPDVTAIRRRLDHRGSRGSRGTAGPGHRFGGVRLAAAAALLVVGVPAAVAVAGKVLNQEGTVVVQVGRPPASETTLPAAGVPPVGTPASDPAGTPASDSPGTPASDPAPRTPGSDPVPTTGPAPTGSTGPAGSASAPTDGASRTGPATPPVRSAVPGPAAPTIVVDPAPGLLLSLGGAPLTDWVVLGARADLKQVRAKASAAAPLLVVAQPVGATSVPGPFSVFWTGGLPEQTHADATYWLGADAATGLSVTVPASTKARTLVLYCGRTVPATVTTWTGDLATARAALAGASGPAQAATVTVRLPAADTPTRIVLAGSPAGPQAGVFLAAVTLQDGRA